MPRGRRSWRSSLLGDPGLKFRCGKLGKTGRKKKSIQEKEERWNPNNRAQPPRSGDCDSAWTSFLRKGGTEVDYQVAAPTELGTPTMHRAKIAQQRVRMEGWRQRRPGSNGRNPQEGKEKKEKNALDSYRSTHGRHWQRGSGYPRFELGRNYGCSERATGGRCIRLTRL
jgi:hypothetical protein